MIALRNFGFNPLLNDSSPSPRQMLSSLRTKRGGRLHADLHYSVLHHNLMDDLSAHSLHINL